MASLTKIKSVFVKKKSYGSNPISMHVAAFCLCVASPDDQQLSHGIDSERNSVFVGSMHDLQIHCLLLLGATL